MTYPLSNVVREPLDNRDFIASVPSTISLPDKVDLRQWAGPIEDQLRTGSCTANATVSALEILLQRAGKFAHLSRLFVYYNERESYESLRGKDGGAYLSDGFKVCAQLGVCTEPVWDFIEANVNVKPSDAAYQAALTQKVTKYERVAALGNPLTAAQQVLRIKAMLAMGYPVTISMAVMNTIFDMTGTLDDKTCQYLTPMTNPFTQSAGGHAMNVVGYNRNGFIVENSWGAGWGDNGYFILGFEVLAKDGFDAWTCTEFAGVSFAPDWSYQPEPPLTVSIKTNPKTQYLPHKGDICITGDDITVDITGGAGPFVTKWAASDPNVGFVSPNITTRPAIIMVVMAPGATKSITITCEVRDCTIPDQQIATCSTQIKVCNSIDIESNYGKAYRLYRSAFGRTPDAGGLAFWQQVLDNGTTLNEVANGFIQSQEWADFYGANPSNADLALLLYTNVLHRAPDPAGLAWWIERLDEGVTKAEVLIGFSESPENKQGAQW